MSDIPIGRIGKILAGRDAGKYVKVERDPGSRSALLILTSDDADFLSPYDDWVLNDSELAKYFEEVGWEIQWTGATTK